ncbi:glycosyltransferase family 2 protein [Flavisolibacter ginsenosidimutans]|uniref:Glycosyltransferase n=1 Tax=Flavisolibacter ginsenosidimutans TaxID=661481 RepID=A0A5B8UEM0_9BACT|nr:glycosyltransferase [Flavisolibacter ginsenosidimutans]QEC54872.1 glycosyltransferase [Flavisolibacter ginsenosidimutans]
MLFAQPDERPLVSVCVITYNHEKYIKAAVESVLMQETDFPCEFIIGEDCSTDNTRKILQEYAERFPIRLLLPEKNQGAQQNWKAVMQAARGKYVAFFEGDDCWTDPQKLAKQFKALEDHPEAVLCYTNAKIFDTKNPDSNIYFREENKPPVFKNKYETVRSCPMPTCTIFFRNVLPELPAWSLKAYAGDYIQVALLAKYGGIYYLDEICGLHVHHYHGLSRAIPLEDFYYNDAPLYLNFLPYFNYESKYFDAVLERYIGTVDKLFHMKQFKRAIKLYWNLPFADILKYCLRIPNIIKQGVKLHFLFFLSKGRTYR